jgi:hypothetical protein
MFRRRPLLWAIALLLGGVSLCFGTMLYLARREPAFYRDAAVASEWDAREKSARLLTRWQDLKNEIISRSEWGETFTAEELNCFFAEHMSRQGGLCASLPPGFHSPRIAIDGDRLKLGFRYREGFWSTIVWVELRIWLVKDETNLIAMEVCELSAGDLPFGSQSILDAISESVRSSNVDVTWYRNKGKPVGLFRLYADQPRPVAQVFTLKVEDGKIVIAGRSFHDQPTGAPVGVNPVPR